MSATTLATRHMAHQRLKLSTLLQYLPVAWLVLAVVIAVLAPLLPIGSPFRQQLLHPLKPPSLSHFLGTDSLGRDIFARSVYGLRISLVIGFASVLFGLAIGGLIGLLSGFFRGLVDTVLSAVMTIILSFPPLVLAIAIMAYAGPSITKVAVALGILFVPAFARVARANALLLSEREFVLAARSFGMHPAAIVLREILPNLATPLLAYATLMVAIAVNGEAALSFLGLSVPPPYPTLGGMIAAERANLLDAPWTILGPALFLFLTILSLNIAGDQLQKRIDRREAAL